MSLRSSALSKWTSEEILRGRLVSEGPTAEDHGPVELELAYQRWKLELEAAMALRLRRWRLVGGRSSRWTIRPMRALQVG